MSGKKILVTGGAGYIGSHCVIELAKDGFEVVIGDNWVNSSQGFYNFYIIYFSFERYRKSLHRLIPEH